MDNQKNNDFFVNNKGVLIKIAIDLVPLVITLFGIAITNKNISYFAEIWISSNGLLWLGIVYFVGYFQNIKEMLRIFQFENEKLNQVIKVFPIVFFIFLIAIYAVGLFGEVNSIPLQSVFNLMIYSLGLGMYLLSSDRIQKQLV